MGLLWVTLGPSWGHCWAPYDPLGPSWSYLGPSWGHLRPSWGCLGPKCNPRTKILIFHRVFNDFEGHLGAIWGHLGAILGHLGAILGHLGATLGPSWATLGPSWAILGPSCGHLTVKTITKLKSIASSTQFLIQTLPATQILPSRGTSGGEGPRRGTRAGSGEICDFRFDISLFYRYAASRSTAHQ